MEEGKFIHSLSPPNFCISRIVFKYWNRVSRGHAQSIVIQFMSSWLTDHNKHHAHKSKWNGRGDSEINKKHTGKQPRVTSGINKKHTKSQKFCYVARNLGYYHPKVLQSHTIILILVYHTFEFYDRILNL